ncbi:HEPN domain-containing protein [Paraclostridium sordellii]|uniref:HEPN domain-containing protein n=1 Tax=Paraclostridium sordellii TaxID=1505 RepID=UPI0005E1BA1D|nr:HEPN domain-containing protein [Paeniclostridium sordellii]CEQ21377.1 Uncharacterised protein [[Clostridium] sordellii] [Paeniclostridium sordellii]
MNSRHNYRARYRALKSRLKELEKHYIKSFYDKDPFELTPRQHDLARGYRVLCHAEIESYLEEIATDLLKYSVDQWNINKKVTITMTAMLTYFHKTEKKDKLGTMFNQGATNFKRQVIEKNHGIRSDNIKKLFRPLGIDIDELDSAWVSTLDTYGSRRGETAHTSARAQQVIDLRAEKQDLVNIVEGIEALEQLIFNLKQ